MIAVDEAGTGPTTVERATTTAATTTVETAPAGATTADMTQETGLTATLVMTTTAATAGEEETMTTPAPVAATSRSRVPTFSVRTRITVAVAVLVALALGGAGALVFVLSHADSEQRVRELVDQEIDEFVKFQQASDLATSRELVTAFLEQNIGAESELQVGYWGGETRVRSFSDRSTFADSAVFEAAADEVAGSGRGQWLQTDLGEVYVDAQPLSDGGAFIVAFFMEDEYDSLYRTMRTYAVAALLALVMVTAVAAWQAGRLLRPVRVLRETAEEIEETDLSRRIPETGNDDITDLTRTVNAMLGRLELAFVGQRAFLDDAGHELRTPLTIVRGHLELVDPDDAAEVARTRELVLDEVDRMSRLVDDLLLLAKADRPDFVVTAPVAVDGLVDQVLEKCRALGDREWVVDAGTDVVAVLDEQRITQALVQLAHNAVKHTRPGDTVGLGSRVVGEMLQLWVRDTGPGVADAHKGQVFRRFGRGEVADDDEGFGLGLSIVSAIASGHAGHVTVYDEVPHGARFVIELPLRRSVTWPAS